MQRLIARPKRQAGNETPASRLAGLVLVGLMFFTFGSGDATADDQPPAARRPRVLFLGQSPDGHPATTHEYMAGVKLMSRLLTQNAAADVVVVNADDPWDDGPELIASADAIVLFLSQGARWLRESPERELAFQEAAARGTGLVCWHWGMGTRQAEDVPTFVKLFGACHGGPDRKYKFLTTDLRPSADHPILTGIEPIRITDEFYYQLKGLPGDAGTTPLLEAVIGDIGHPVAWATERSHNDDSDDGPSHSGRSFGFSGGHFHAAWSEPTYRRLFIHGLLWTLHHPIPADGAAINVPPEWLHLPTD